MAYNHKIQLKVFISYSHKDLEWLERLRVHLRPLEREYGVDFWDDTRINSGSKWKKEIENALESAKIAVLLMSADFLASEFVTTDELPPLLSAAEHRGTIILPLILSPCRFLRVKSLSQFQAINDPMNPLINMSRGEQEAILDKVAHRVEMILEVDQQKVVNHLDQPAPKHNSLPSRPAPQLKDLVTYQPTPTYVDPSDDIFTRMKEIIIDELGVDESEITPNARFIDDLGADSLDLVELAMVARRKARY